MNLFAVPRSLRWGENIPRSLTWMLNMAEQNTLYLLSFPVASRTLMSGTYTLNETKLPAIHLQPRCKWIEQRNSMHMAKCKTKDRITFLQLTIQQNDICARKDHPPILTGGERWVSYMLDVITEGGRRGRGDSSALAMMSSSCLLGGEWCTRMQDFSHGNRAKNAANEVLEKGASKSFVEWQPGTEKKRVGDVEKENNVSARKAWSSLVTLLWCHFQPIRSGVLDSLVRMMQFPVYIWPDSSDEANHAYKLYVFFCLA